VDRLLRIENLWVVALLLVAVLVGLGARWRGDPRMGGVAVVINRVIRIGFALLVIGIALFLALVIFMGPFGP
jgi:hypothetical protein